MAVIKLLADANIETVLNYKEKIPNHFSIITRTKFRFIPLEDII